MSFTDSIAPRGSVQRYVAIQTGRATIATALTGVTYAALTALGCYTMTVRDKWEPRFAEEHQAMHLDGRSWLIDPLVGAYVVLAAAVAAFPVAGCVLLTRDIARDTIRVTQEHFTTWQEQDLEAANKSKIN
jgi:hypothetical protein